MDKKKVKSTIEEIIWYITTEFSPSDASIKIRHLADEVLKELSKSDWVSVEDGLPEYGENVWVRSLINPDSVWCTRRTTLEKDARDSNDFINIGHCSITHWKPIEKLEE